MLDFEFFFNFQKRKCNFCFHPRIFSRNEKKKKRKNRNQTNVENIIYFRLHDLSSSKWIDPHTPPLCTHKTKPMEWMRASNRKNGQTDKSNSAVTESWARTLHWIWKAAKLRTGFPNSSEENVRQTNENGCIHRKRISSRIIIRV